ncbi:MAG TPA: 2Fe-2S iron-sulfur cluster-binding protein [Polyangiaceae bacterium LLY-WYZ-15_(1-7)]|nr:2Fe-2S iron-sulfur cluster-binding protein [Polyangiaceae bacterium LLY-WYZ-15_(1-7)]HJL08259.1 2Fe-2S iron-sulfur cluster-binding protein [Polyangiaceae bacterium LLY-WYZ-15_(1-7)]HJL20667.1 2Fe-2S iron-sulfur cluster-binding protein [Polyangiaceae bacterium LLY-WYZ-15_(1-7)]HJL36342.1 2Fe-2S iron-sulfur cluster-binding protein [Polyangiaceae bacterium LLY-WYZ-15_(1-7)]HJL46985.1 2Fe-2S iron-sulfur cluster-binding protein [Polyangiaceae bacterium LLY-WYZ-15_(1-7)]
MPTFKLNGQEIPFEPGDTIIRAAWRQGIEIPHYCWHPGLSIAANCRMCLVHVTSGRQMAMPVLRWDEKKKEYVPDTKPKLVPACQTGAQADMEVDSVGPEVQQAQAHVQEFLLLNHPVDCPICDQAGECKLQDYYEEHQHTLKRKRTEPVHKPKGVRFGPTIVYDAERCIMCTRCIRVCDELVGDHVLDMRERGNRNEIVLAPGRELDHRYTLMTEHVCPVGALTSRDFRFKARVWFLKTVDGICTGCATGCNSHVDFDPRYGKVYRLRPRDNEQVNGFWMCDDGMMTYQEAHEHRVVTAVDGRGEDAEKLLQEEATEELAARLKGLDAGSLAVVLSAHHASEDNFVLAEVAKALGVKHVYLAAREAEDIGWEGDDILRHADPNPNRAGATAVAEALLGEAPGDLEDLVGDVLAGQVKSVLALGAIGGEKEGSLDALKNLADVIVLTANEGPLPSVASLTVPVASWAEMFGTFRNAKGLDQHFVRAIPSPEGIEPAWKTLVAAAQELGLEGIAYARTGEVRTAMNDAAAPAAGDEAQASAPA